MADYMHQRLSSFPNSVEMERQIGKAFMMDGRSTVAWQIGIQAQNRTTSHASSKFRSLNTRSQFLRPLPASLWPWAWALSPPDRKPKSRGTSGLGRNNQSVPSKHCDQRRAPVTPMVPLRPVKNNSARSNVVSPHRVHSSLSQTRPSSPFPAARRAAASIA
ncbi:hypothetical protein BGZ61DRAFT_10962 [Ilyonectria robusta]|uniref:uncharacterized protein n=1 Tax=Ilyonectria robusta TaxID=1079257 RepID=UPI001E8D447D|nr:uncharacterized protein BGZ61DRAFT_10962 [Ilyonectria robusta]KAH8737220.1 hypothetical protein BGZ61DRAFT_10962 [Ilyonectria robusta]